MVFEFVEGINSTDTLLLLVLFLLFVISVKKLIKIIMNVIWIFIAAILFPLAANRLLGIPVPADFNTMLTFAAVGIGAYIAYTVFRSVYGVAKITAKVTGKMIPKGKGKKEVVHAERPKASEETEYEPVKRFVEKSHKAKSEKELFKNYVVIEDADAGEKKAQKQKMEKIKEIKFEKEKKKTKDYDEERGED